MKKTMRDSVGDFMAGKGFYIVLLLCVAALGVSGYYLFSGFADPPGQTVSAPVTVVVTPRPASPSAAPATGMPAVTAAPPSTAAPRPTPAAQTAAPIPTATAAPAPAATPAPTPATATASVFTWPVKGELLRGHDGDTLSYDETMGDWRSHAGVDIAAPAGTEVVSPAGGTVEQVETTEMMGTAVTIRHAGGVVSVCANLAAVPTVEVGDTVRTGDVIGSIGGGAMKESALPGHLHLSMTRDGVNVDPLDYLPGQ